MFIILVNHFQHEHFVLYPCQNFICKKKSTGIGNEEFKDCADN